MEHDVKDMLEIAIANNDSLWEVEVIDRLQGELERLYSQEAKAKAFDEIREARKEVLSDVRERGLKLPTDLDEFSMMTERIINKYESGESDV